MTSKLRILLLLCLPLLAGLQTLSAQTWSVQPSSTSEHLDCVWAFNSTNAWTGGTNGVIRKWNGTVWSAQSSGITDGIEGIWGTSATNVWAVADGGQILRYNGTAWSLSTTAAQGLSGIWGADANNIFAVGQNGLVMRWNGTSWSTMTTGVTDSLSSVSGLSANQVWAAGSSGRIIYWNGTSWATQTSGTSFFIATIYAVNSSFVLAASSNQVMKWDGTSWTSSSIEASFFPKGYWGPTANKIYAVGYTGKIYLWNGTTWAAQTSGITRDLVAISGTPTLDIWAVGPAVPAPNTGLILRGISAPPVLHTYTLMFSPPGSGIIEYNAGAGVQTITDDDQAGKKTLKLPVGNVTFTVKPYPGYTLSSISSPQSTPTLLHNTVMGGPKLDAVTPLSPTFTLAVSAARTLNLLYTGKAEEPTASFVATSPPEGKATPVSSATGNYAGVMGVRLYDFDIATDETGKLTGMGTVEGMNKVTPGTPPTSTPDLTIDGSLSTLSGKPTASINGSLSGTVGALAPGATIEGSMKTQVPFDPAPQLNAKLLSGSGKAPGLKTKSLTNANVPLPAPVGGATRTWSYAMDIMEKTDAKGVKYKAATVLLTLPTGDKILFPEKPVKYVAKTGYSISCTFGIKLDATGKPILILNSAGALITVAKTSLTFTNLKFAKPGAKWMPSAGAVKYVFLGQTGTANVIDFGTIP